MEESGIHFGTSGIRGESRLLTDFVCFSYTKGFLKFLETNDGLKRKGKVAIAGDLRKSTDEILTAVIRAIKDSGYNPVYIGKIPTPALALFGITKSIPSVMITGSHIPSDRNGIKFYKKSGEILKNDEQQIKNLEIEIEDNIFDSQGSFLKKNLDEKLIINNEAEKIYLERLPNFFKENALDSMRVVVYQHSAVSRDILVDILRKLGATVEIFGRSEEFIPIDTEALDEKTIDLAKTLAKEKKFDAIVTTDGDGDRPLVGDENGEWLKGDISGILCAKILEADSVTTTISANTSLEKSLLFKDVRRVKIGSPYVIESLQQATESGFKKVVGFENNGGFFLNSDIIKDGKKLEALPTRDGAIVIASILVEAKTSHRKISDMRKEISLRFTDAGHIQDFPSDTGLSLIKKLFGDDNEENNLKNAKDMFGGLCGTPQKINRLDGARIIFQNGEIIHIRPSGNAPELRCYVEADSPQRAAHLKEETLKKLNQLK